MLSEKKSRETLRFEELSLLGDDINSAGSNIINSSLISQDCSQFLQTQLDT